MQFNIEGNTLRFQLAATCALAALATPAFAQSADEPDGSFDLGQIVVRADLPQAPEVGASSVGKEAIETFNRNTLDDAAALIPGVSAPNSGGSRNERLLFVRGFDRFQVPLSIDGIRVYLPADNRLDYGRFLTPDLAEIQVAKGYASVLDGPGAMGGAVNLVTRKPVREIEAEARAVLDLDGDLDYAGYNAFALLGTRQDQWYAQASFTRNVQDHWDLPGDFVPTVSEDGGERDFSRNEDWRLNLKVGFTPMRPTNTRSATPARKAPRTRRSAPSIRSRSSATGPGRGGTSTASISSRAPRSAMRSRSRPGLTATASTTC